VFMSGAIINFRSIHVRVLLYWLVLTVAAVADRYVSLQGTNDAAGQYTTWSGAATNIKWAVDFAANGETVWVSNGTYYLTNHIVLANSIVLKSFSGIYTNTIINGNWPGTTNRCFYLNNTGAVVEGFTITNGCAPTNNEHGGGVYINAGTLRNCLVTGNQVTNSGNGGGVYATGASSLITNCDLIANCVYAAGGGAFIKTKAQMSDCRVMYNYQSRDFASSGGFVGGGVCVSEVGTLLCNSMIISNRAPNGNYTSGGGVQLYYGSKVRNCLIMGNYAWAGGGAALGLSSTNVIENCTIVSNRATYGGSIHINFTATQLGHILNTICYSNYSGIANSEFYLVGGPIVFSNCWMPTTSGITGAGNVTNKPILFVDFTGQNYRLTVNSPCVNRGLNQDWMNNALDLEGRKRLRYGTVDIGAYEFINDGTIYRFR